MLSFPDFKQCGDHWRVDMDLAMKVARLKRLDEERRLSGDAGNTELIVSSLLQQLLWCFPITEIEKGNAGIRTTLYHQSLAKHKERKKKKKDLDHCKKSSCWIFLVAKL